MSSPSGLIPADNKNASSLPSQTAGEKPHQYVETPYSIFTPREKWFIVAMISFAGLFSALTTNIYLPAIPLIASAFHKSTELINLTVTVYMALQGISPMFWGPLADRWGRRPIILVCLTTLALSCVGLALTPVSAYWLLLVLRCFQAVGSASTVAIGAGVIGDISVAAERGGFFGLYTIGPLIGPAIVPVIGGALADGLGWRAIFWFLCIASASYMLFLFLLLPETLRSIVGNGSIPAPKAYQPLVPTLGKRASSYQTSHKPSPPSLPNPLRILMYPDIIAQLVFNGISYAVFNGVTATTASLFQRTYPFLSETTIGLSYLPIGGGMILGSVVTGKVLDWDYQRYKKRLRESAPIDPEKRSNDMTMDDNFPIERIRLRTIPVFLVMFVATVIGYGWCIQRRAHLSGSLILQFIIGYSEISILNSTQTLLVDLLPSQSSSVTACNNLIRCGLGAALVAVAELIINAITPGWAFVLFGGLAGAAGPLMYVVMRIGPACRAKRRGAK